VLNKNNTGIIIIIIIIITSALSPYAFVSELLKKKVEKQ